eukprot:3649849-Prymnesium_polylepis.3
MATAHPLAAAPLARHSWPFAIRNARRQLKRCIGDIPGSFGIRATRELPMSCAPTRPRAPPGAVAALRPAFVAVEGRAPKDSLRFQNVSSRGGSKVQFGFPASF